MRLGALIVGVLALLIVTVVATRLRRSATWPSVQGTIDASSINEIYNRPGSIGAEDLESIEYEFVVEYTYRVAGQEYRGRQLAVGLPAVFSRSSEAERTAARFPPGARVPVYYDPTDPSQAALVTAAGASPFALVFVGLFVLAVIAAIAVGGLFVTGRIGPSADDGIERPFQPE